LELLYVGSTEEAILSAKTEADKSLVYLFACCSGDLKLLEWSMKELELFQGGDTLKRSMGLHIAAYRGMFSRLSHLSLFLSLSPKFDSS
jgi:hypothetical protein